MITERQQRINELETLVHRLAWNDAMGCHTRDGFAKYIWPGVLKDPKKNPRYFVFFDVDGVHALNESAGTYDVFDGIMREVNATVRSTDAVVAQKNSGDEFLLCLIETPDRHAPAPEKVIDLGSPSAFCALAITVFASCAIAVPPRNPRQTTSRASFFTTATPPVHGQADWPRGLVVLHRHLLVLHPGPFDVVEGLRGASNPGLDRVVEARRRG